MKKSLAYILVLAALAIVAYDNRDRVQSVLGMRTNHATTAVSTYLKLKPAPQARGLEVCDDPSGSTNASFAESIKASLIRAIEGYVPKKPTVTKGGVEPITGVDLSVRLVSSRPLAYGAPYYQVKISGAAGLPPRPDMTAAGALDPGGSYETWKDLETEWRHQYDSAASDMNAAVAKLRKIDLSQPSESGIHDCLGALATTAPNLRDVTYVIASDLEDNTDGASKVSFAGHPLVVIQACPSGQAGECSRVFNRFRAWAKARQSGHITTVRPEVSGDAIRKLVEGD